MAKGLTSAYVQLGAVGVRRPIANHFGKTPFPGGLTYNSHPLACAAALATQDLYRDENLFGRARKLEPVWADAVMSLKGLPNVLDIRTVGLVAAIDLASRPDAVGQRAYEALERAFEDGLMIRVTGETIALTPPLIISEDQIGELVDKVGQTIRAVA
jgi:beta-alanine--pyruvate transaminase